MSETNGVHQQQDNCGDVLRELAEAVENYRKWAEGKGSPIAFEVNEIEVLTFVMLRAIDRDKTGEILESLLVRLVGEINGELSPKNPYRLKRTIA